MFNTSDFANGRLIGRELERWLTAMAIAGSFLIN